MKEILKNIIEQIVNIILAAICSKVGKCGKCSE